MAETYQFAYYDLRGGRKSDTPETIFRNWKQSGDESVVILSPQDHDGLLGAGYLILACLQEEVQISVVICCDGRSGYSAPEQKPTIAAVRRKEAEAAYARLGLAKENLVHLGFPDFSLAAHRGLMLPGRQEGNTAQILRTLRQLRATRLMVPNGFRESGDSTAAYYIATEEGPRVGDPVLMDQGIDPGRITPIRTFLQYSVWGDFAPDDAMIMGADPRKLRANLAIVVDREAEEKAAEAIACFRSQEKIIEPLVAQRRGRFFEGRAMELYLWYDPRRPLRYQPYHAKIREIG